MPKPGDKVPYKAYSQLCTDLDLANVEIKRLKKVLKDIGDEAMNIPENSQAPELNEGINTILMMAEQALKEK